MNKQRLLDLFTSLSERLSEIMYSEFAGSDKSAKRYDDEHEQRVAEFKKALDETEA